MIGSINNVNSLKVNSVKANNISFGRKKTYTTTTTTTVAEGKPKEKKGFFAKIGLAIAAVVASIFTIGAIAEKKDKKASGEQAPTNEAPAEETPANETKTDETTAEVTPQEETPTETAPVAEEETEVAPVVEEEVEVAPVAEEETEVAPVTEEEVEVAPVTEEETEVAPVTEEEVEVAPVTEEETEVVPVTEEVTVDETKPAIEEVFVDETPETEEVVIPVSDEASAVAVASEADAKKQAQAMVTAGVAGAMAQTLSADTDEVSAVEYADAQKAQLGIATPVKVKEAPKAELKPGNDGFKFDPKMEIQMLEDAFETSLKGEEAANDIKASLKEYRQYVKEADKNDFADIQTADGGVVAFEKRVEYPTGETTGIVDEAITKHTREKEKQEILTATKLDAQGNISGVATYVNGRIDSLTEYTKDGRMNVLQADDKGVLLAKGMKPTETGFAFDEIMNFDYVGDVRRLVSCAKGVKIENGTTTIEKAYKYDNDNNLKEFAKEVTISADSTGSLAHDFQFESDNLVAAASLYSGDLSVFGKGTAADVFAFENGEIISHGKMCEYTVNA